MGFLKQSLGIPEGINQNWEKRGPKRDQKCSLSGEARFRKTQGIQRVVEFLASSKGSILGSHFVLHPHSRINWSELIINVNEEIGAVEEVKSARFYKEGEEKYL